MYILREIEKEVVESSKEYPVVTITGPRQSGKTTLVKHLFPKLPYYSLEAPDIREMVKSDPRQFLSTNVDGAILDEIQRAPELLSYLQEMVDNATNNPLFILAGSNQIELINGITQTLAGRTALIKLLPFSVKEVMSFTQTNTTDSLLIKGFYPGIHTKKRNAHRAHSNYYQTYIERDLRQTLAIQNLSQFQHFVKLCASRVAQLLNTSAIANEVGVSVPTIKSWLSILESSFIIYLLKPWHSNLGKRLIKSPKIYFYDVGMATYLLGIENEQQMSRDPLRGNLFENLVVIELLKKLINKGKSPDIYFYRDSNGNEVDVLALDKELNAYEIKSSQTYHSSFLKGLLHIKEQKIKISNFKLLYNGDFSTKQRGIDIINYVNYLTK